MSGLSEQERAALVAAYWNTTRDHVHVERAVEGILAARTEQARPKHVVKAEALREAREAIRARRAEFRRLQADPQYLNALDDCFGLVSNQLRALDRADAVEAGGQP